VAAAGNALVGERIAAVHAPAGARQAKRGDPVFVVLSAVQMVPRLRGRADAILDAQQARGLDTSGSLPRRARALLPLVAPVLLGSLIDVRERTFALEARGFGAKAARTAYREVVDPPGDRLLRILLLLGFVAVIVMAIANPFRL